MDAGMHVPGDTTMELHYEHGDELGHSGYLYTCSPFSKPGVL